MAEASDRINENTKADLLEQVKKQVTKADVVAVLGLSYKPDTYIVEESAGLFLAQHLKRQGYKVVVHDGAAAPSNCPSLHEFEVLKSVEALKSRKDVKLVVVCCPWPQYKNLEVAVGTSVISPWF